MARTLRSRVAAAIGDTLVGLNHTQLDREADFRTGLLHVREHADALALLYREERQKAALRDRLDAAVANARRIIAVNRNVGFFTTGYQYLIQIIPTLLVALLFIRGDVAFGVITQSAMAFTMLMGAFSLIVTQFTSISGYAPVSGALVVPRAAEPGSLEAEVSFQGYGVKSVQLNLGGGRKRISFQVNAHGVANGQDADYDHSLRATVFFCDGFNADRNASRERSFFNGMLLRAMLSIAAVALDSDVTFCYAWSPWGCDLSRTERGRLVGGWHVAYTPEIRCFDPFYFAKRVKPECRLEIVANLGDYVCPPSGMWVA